MENKSAFHLKELFFISNLFSLARLLLTIPAMAFLWSDSPRAPLYCLATLILAGLTDFFDGYFARRLNQNTALGLALDPLADKILAGGMIIGLVVTRDFPLWLAALIVTRDIAILGASLIMMRKIRHIPPSDITGKYYFGALVMLLVSFVINYEFGRTLFIGITILLWLLSVIDYILVFQKMKMGTWPAENHIALLPRSFYPAGAILVMAIYLAGLIF